MDLFRDGAAALAARFARGTASPVEALESCLDRIARLDPRLGCFLSLRAEAARAEARDSAARWRAGAPRGPLDGVPVAVKDNLCVGGEPTTAGSRVLAGWRASYDATVVARLRAAGAVIVGKTNLDEFSMGSSSERSAWRPVANPWDLSRVPGGSSGGSAAAVAAGLAPLALGSDTGGSVRQPAALCGVVGLRPTWGRVSRRGLVAFASSLDQVGPLARSVADAAALLAAVAGHDPLDATSSTRPAPAGEVVPAELAGLRVGVPDEYFGPGLDPELATSIRAALDRLAEAGARVEPVSLPHTAHGIACYYVLANAEASSNLARYDGVRYGLRVAADGLAATIEATREAGFGDEVKRRILLGTWVLSAGYQEELYGRALRARERIADDFARAFARVDVLATPAAPGPAFRLGEKLGDPLAMYLADAFTVPSALAGLPGLVVPCGSSRAGLPLAVQLLGPPFEDERLLAAGAALEARLGLAGRIADPGEAA